ncbi:unnamed protein product [Caenorhabditis angaria]|uniref:Uncharacterized protein n=1 Tax=Caenorhabditis angaria TaxID=860376 RepID=A0A9P1N0H5_9PELO|nr:unnamed protein product [Caenorhabditis angaria]
MLELEVDLLMFIPILDCLIEANRYSEKLKKKISELPIVFKSNQLLFLRLNISIPPITASILKKYDNFRSKSNNSKEILRPQLFVRFGLEIEFRENSKWSRIYRLLSSMR